jgi:hypothetical protein
VKARLTEAEPGGFESLHPLLEKHLQRALLVLGHMDRTGDLRSMRPKAQPATLALEVAQSRQHVNLVGAVRSVAGIVWRDVIDASGLGNVGERATRSDRLVPSCTTRTRSRPHGAGQPEAVRVRARAARGLAGSGQVEHEHERLVDGPLLEA